MLERASIVKRKVGKIMRKVPKILRRVQNMTRDMDFIRELLLRVEQDQEMNGQNTFFFDSAEDMGISGHSTEETAYHLELLIRAGFIDGAVESGYPIPSVRSLTWEGHEFLENIKNDDVWTATKGRLAGLPGVALSAVAAIAMAEIKKKLGLP
jgi:hypothetical protein